MKTPLPKKNLPDVEANQNKEWLRKKLFQQKKVSQIRPIQFRGTQHRG